LERLEITPLDTNGRQRTAERFAVLFNPATYSVGKTVGWTPLTGPADRQTNAPVLEFNGGRSRTLSLELFYDVTEPVTVGGARQQLDDVRQETSRMVALTRIEKGSNMRPPVVEVSWGGAGPDLSDFPFRGVVTSLSQSFTLFSAAGKPLRATLSVQFTESLDKELDQKKTDPVLTTRVVRGGDRLDAIAADYYGDPAQWRRLAAANRIDDPRRLPAGTRLTIPAS
jgi:nucleoid-associated protein YgaU